MSDQTTHKYVAVVGNLSGDLTVCNTYRNCTLAQAHHAFTLELRADNDIPESDVVAGYEYASVYIRHTLTSDSPIILESCA